LRLVNILILAPIIAIACSTVRAPVVPDHGRLHSIRTAYVVVPPGENRGTDASIQVALAKHGIRVSKGSEASRPRDVDAYVTFAEIWRWDMVMYLESLDVSLFDSTTNALIASGQFRNSFFHSYPSAPDKVQEVVDSLFSTSITD